MQSGNYAGGGSHPAGTFPTTITLTSPVPAGEEVIIIIDDAGQAACIHHYANDQAVKEFAGALGGAPAVTKRASHIEPCNRLLRLVFHGLRALWGDDSDIAAFTRSWPCLWRVNLSPVHGPKFGAYRDRQAALEAEVSWLEHNYNPHEPNGR